MRRSFGRLARWTMAVAVLVGAIAGASPVTANAPPACAADDGSPGNDWALYGNTPDNARHQVHESRLDAEALVSLDLLWRFKPGDHGLAGGFSNTPIVLDGCVYIGTTLGHVAALNAETGDVVWVSEQLDGNAVLTSANPITGSVTVVDDTIYVGVTRSGSPYVAALDRWTGDLLWTSVIEDAQPEAFTVPAPVYHDGLIFQGFSVYFAEGIEERGGYAIIDASRACSLASATTCTSPVPGASGGELLIHRYVIPDDDYQEHGYGGAGVWCTAAVDVETSMLYACTSNPASPREHRYTNSLLKIDFRRGSATLGEILAAYKGTPDNYVDGAERQPLCDEFPNLTDPYYSATCVQFDLDFGASPHLFRNSRGDQLVGTLQKSGVYHAAYADNLQGAWKATVGTPCLFWCNGASAAHDGEKVYVVGSPGATMWSLGMDQGHHRWAWPVGNAFHYHPVSVANGIAYTVNSADVLVGVDTATGIPVLERAIASDVGALPSVELKSSGIAIARSTLYVQTGEWLVAYR